MANNGNGGFTGNSSGAPMLPVQGSPGVWVDRGGNKYQVLNVREDVVYDTILIPAGAIAAGSEFLFFTQFNQKRQGDSNMKSPRLGSGVVMKIYHYGFKILDAAGNIIMLPRDMKKVISGGFAKIKLGGFDIAEGPVERFQSPFGLTGSTTENDSGLVSLGVPSQAAMRPLAEPIFVDQNADFEGSLRFDDHLWTAGGMIMPTLDRIVAVRLYFLGLVGKAATQS